MIKKRILVFAFLLLLAASVVHAENFTIEIVSLKESILPGEKAEFSLIVKSNSPKIQEFSIYSNDVLWDLTTDPSGAKNRLKVYPFKQTTVRFNLNPSKQLPVGIAHGIPVVVKSILNKESLTTSVNVFLKSPSGAIGAYVPAVLTKVNMPSKVMPSEELKISVELVNQNNLNITELEVVLRSELVNKKYETTLDPLDSKTLDFTIQLDPLQEPVKDVIYVQVTANNVEFEPRLVSYEIVEYGEVSEEKKVKLGFMTSTTTIKVINNGNARRTHEVQVKMPFFKRSLTFTNPDASTEEINGKTYLVWELTLDKNTTSEVSYSTNYQIIFWVLIAVALAILLYYKYRSPVLVKKEVRIVMRKEGGISELAIQVNIKNRSKTDARHLKLIDKIPHLVELLKEAKPGTIQPSKILKHEKKGTIIEWEMGKLEPAEERIISYRVRAKLIILGEVSLPVAVAKYSLEGETKSRIKSSNNISMISER